MATIRLSWPANPVAELVDNYQVHQQVGGVWSELAVVPGNQTSYDIVNPAPANYAWKVRAVNVTGVGQFSPQVSSPPVPTSPGQPTIEVV